MRLYIKVPYMKRGKIAYKKVQNIGKVKGILTFKIDQQYAFQCAPLGDTEASMTVIRMTIPAGTPVSQGYVEIFESLHKMGYEPDAVCEAMGFTEVCNGVPRCGELVDRVTCDQPDTGEECCTIFNCPHLARFHGCSA